MVKFSPPRSKSHDESHPFLAHSTPEAGSTRLIDFWRELAGARGCGQHETHGEIILVPRYKRVSAEWEAVISKICLLLACVFFILPMPYFQLREAATFGPVVITLVGSQSSQKFTKLILISLFTPLSTSLSSQPDLWSYIAPSTPIQYDFINPISDYTFLQLGPDAQVTCPIFTSFREYYVNPNRYTPHATISAGDQTRATL